MKKRVLHLFRVKSWVGGNQTPCSDGPDFLVLTELEDTPLQSPQAWPQIMMLLQIKGNAFIDSQIMISKISDLSNLSPQNKKNYYRLIQDEQNHKTCRNKLMGVNFITSICILESDLGGENVQETNRIATHSLELQNTLEYITI